jgi:hypothetical protein
MITLAEFLLVCFGQGIRTQIDPAFGAKLKTVAEQQAYLRTFALQQGVSPGVLDAPITALTPPKGGK